MLLMIIKTEEQRQKETGETTEETSGYVGLEQLNKWPNAMIAR